MAGRRQILHASGRWGHAQQSGRGGQCAPFEQCYLRFCGWAEGYDFHPRAGDLGKDQCRAYQHWGGPDRRPGYRARGYTGVTRPPEARR